MVKPQVVYNGHNLREMLDSDKLPEGFSKQEITLPELYNKKSMHLSLCMAKETCIIFENED